jgi:hypothetical protein
MTGIMPCGWHASTMPRHIRTFLLITLVLAVVQGLLVFQEAAGSGASRLLLYVVMPGAFVVTGIAQLAYGGKQEEEKDRQVAKGSSIVPFGCFLVSVAIACWVALLDVAAKTVTG